MKMDSQVYKNGLRSQVFTFEQKGEEGKTRSPLFPSLFSFIMTPFHFTLFMAQKITMTKSQSGRWPLIKCCSQTPHSTIVSQASPLITLIHSRKSQNTNPRLSPRIQRAFSAELEQSKCSVQLNLATRVYIHKHKRVWK